MIKENYSVTGMSCASCSSRIQKAVGEIKGVTSVNVNLLKNSMMVEYDETIINNGVIIDTVRSIGYGASLKNDEKIGSLNTPFGTDESIIVFKNYKKRLILSLFFEIPLFYICMGHMLKWPLPSIVHDPHYGIAFAFTQFLLLIPIVGVNFNYFKNGFKALFHRSPNMDSLVSLGVIASLFYGIYQIYRMAYFTSVSDFHQVHTLTMNLYFEGAGTILTLITLGKTLEAYSKRKTTDEIRSLMNLSPKTAVLINENGNEEEVDINSVKVNDILSVKRGDSVPLDGVIIEGSASIDESMITGESIPINKKVGDEVVGGTINKLGYIKIRVTKIGDDTVLANIIRLVDEATSSKAPIAAIADKVSAVFVPVVISIAFISFFVWLVLGYGFEFALGIGISVLVISCPCALGLAVPTAIMVGTGVGAKKGVLIKSAESLETLHSIDTVVFDKTGTITEGTPSVTDIITYGEMSKSELLKSVGSIEKLSEHPLSLAIVKKAGDENVNFKEVSNFEQIDGVGVRGSVDGTVYYIGNNKVLDLSRNSTEIKKTNLDYERLSDEGKTVLFVSKDDKLVGVLAIMDVVKESSARAIQSIKNMGIDVIMLTGDNKRTASVIAREVGIDNVISEVRPEEKDKVIERLKNEGHKVAVVGDGINDAPSLKRSDVGIAIGRGTDVAIEASDVVLMKSTLDDVTFAIKLSKAVMKNIKENLFWAFFYNCLGIPLASGVFYKPFALMLNPMFAAFAMGCSSVFVVCNALRLRLFKGEGKHSKGISGKIQKQDLEKHNKQIDLQGLEPGTEIEQDLTKNNEQNNLQGLEPRMETEQGLTKHNEQNNLQVLEPRMEIEQDLTKNNEQNNLQGLEPRTETEQDLTKHNEQKKEKDMFNNQKIELNVKGMSCMHCVGRVEEALKSVDGVKSVKVELDTGKATVKCEKGIDIEVLKKAVVNAGYEVV